MYYLEGLSSPMIEADSATYLLLCSLDRILLYNYNI